MVGTECSVTEPKTLIIVLVLDAIKVQRYVSVAFNNIYAIGLSLLHDTPNVLNLAGVQD